MTKKIDTPQGALYITSPGLPLRPGERAIFATAAPVDLPGFFSMIHEHAGLEGEYGEGSSEPEDLRWRVTVQDMRPNYRG